MKIQQDLDIYVFIKNVIDIQFVFAGFEIYRQVISAIDIRSSKFEEFYLTKYNFF
jgi:hypothetical protein